MFKVKYKNNIFSISDPWPFNFWSQNQYAYFSPDSVQSVSHL